MASINWTMGATYWGTNSWETIGTITTGSKKCSSVTCVIPMGTGNGTFTSGSTLTGTGNSLSISCKLNEIIATNTVSNSVGTKSYSGGTYPNPDHLQNYTFKFTGTFAANTTYTLTVKTPSCSNGGTGNVLCIASDNVGGTYSYVEVEDNIIITFKGNGGTLSKSSVTIESGSAVGTLPTGSYPITVTYNPNGGSVQPTSASRNRTLSSYNTKSDGSGTKVTSSSTFTANTTVYAIWGNATLGDLPTPTRTNCKYRRWTTTKNGTTAVTSSTTTKSNITIYADWTYKLTYNGNGGSYTDADGAYQTSATEYKNYGNNTISSSYTFVKYDDDGIAIGTMTNYNASLDGSGTSYSKGSSITITSPTTIYAQYSTYTYTVTFTDGYSGKVLKTQTVNYNGSATPPVNPTRAGYTFSGWLGDYTNVKSNVTIQALWESAAVWYRKNGQWVNYEISEA